MVDQPEKKQRYRTLQLPKGLAEVWLEANGHKVSMHTKQPNGGGTTNWDRCDTAGCLGVAITIDRKCFAHAHPEHQLAYIERITHNGGALQLQGVHVTPQIISTILQPPVTNQDHVFIPILLLGAEIDAQMQFTGLTFHNYFNITGAIVRQPMPLRKCVFHGPLIARHTFFDNGPPSFHTCEFNEQADLSYAHAEKVSIGFDNCIFHKSFRAEGIEAALLINHCTMEGPTTFDGAKAPIINIESCSIKGELTISEAACGAFRAKYLAATSTHQLGPITLEHDCTFRHTQFDARVRLEVEARRLDLTGTQFLNGGELVLGRAAIDLSNVSSGKSLHISGNVTIEQRPWVQSVQNADAGSMTFAHLSMRRCIFYGSHNLRNTVIEPTVDLDIAPGFYRRRCVADEVAWRSKSNGLFAESWKRLARDIEGSRDGKERKRDTLIELPPLQSAQVATVYRDLRSSFEGKSDQPGASDFYYGEMEMRRHSPVYGLSDRAIVFAYGMLSGYGLRASLALFWLALVTAISSYLMACFGFELGPYSYMNGLLFCLKAVIPGIRSTEMLTEIGEGIEITLALAGPFLLGLFLLALRGRVKR